MGVACARGLQDHTAFRLCYNGIRPIGAFVYFTVPRLMSDDPVTAMYLTAGLNTLMFLLLVKALRMLVGEGWESAGTFARPLGRVMLLLGALALALPFLPGAL